MLGHGAAAATAYVRRHRFEVGLPLQFDQTYDRITSLEYVLGALAADVVVGLQRLARKRRVEVERVEAFVQGALDNPLAFLQVVGEEGHPGLARVALKVYVTSPASPERLEEVWQETLRTSPLVRTFGDRVALTLEHAVVL